jgi:hypothetical protein
MTKLAIKLTRGIVENSNRVRQVYGYAVCLIAVITVLTSLGQASEAAIDLASPMQAAGVFGQELASFEVWVPGAQRDARRTPAGEAVIPDTASLATYRARYEAIRSTRIQQVLFQSRRRLVSQTLVLVVAIGLFVAHWRWLRRSRVSTADAA